MGASTILANSLWAALFAIGLGVLLTAPPRYLPAACLCGFLGRGLRDVCTSLDMHRGWATLIAAMVVVLVALAFTRGRPVSPVVLICGVLPLGAAVAMFNMIFALVQVSSARGDEVGAAIMAVGANAGEVFTTSLAIALGLGGGIAVQWLLEWAASHRRV